MKQRKAMTQYKDIVELQRLKLNKERDEWYIHVNNGAGYTEVKQGNTLTITYHDTGKKEIIVNAN
jgi:peptidyl-tRNA hydrolase